MKELRIIIAGGRDFCNTKLLSEVLTSYLRNVGLMDATVTFISGTARGADSLGEQFAISQNYPVKRFPADWDNLGKNAGYARNEQMAKYAAEKTGVLFAFWDGKSKGTKHMIDLASRYGLKVYVIHYET